MKSDELNEVINILEDNEFDMDWNNDRGIEFRKFLSRLIKGQQLLNPIIEDNLYVRRQDVIDTVIQNYKSESERMTSLQELPVYAPIQYEHRYADSTLRNMSKEDLIAQIHCLVNNNDALQERITNQSDYLNKFVKKLENYEAAVTVEPEKNERPYYFTFGSNENFPYQNGHIIIYAENEKIARETFNQFIPPRYKDSPCLNCSFFYSEKLGKKLHSPCYATIKDGKLKGTPPNLSYVDKREPDYER